MTEHEDISSEFLDSNDIETQKELYNRELPEFQKFIGEQTNSSQVSNEELQKFVENPNEFVKGSSPIQRLAIGKHYKQYKDKKKMEKVIELFKVTSITKTLNTFDGDKSQIYNFISSVDETLLLCESIKELECFKVVERNIRQKIIGKANQSLTNHNITNNWDSIKKHLIEQFADKRDEANLLFELYGLVKQNIEPKILYEKICSINTLLSNQLKIKELSNEIVEYQLQQYRSTSLIIFMASLREPLGTWLRARDPKTLEDAYEYVIKETNIKSLKGIPQQQFKKPFKNFTRYQSYPSGSTQQIKIEPNQSNGRKQFYNKSYSNQNFQNKFIKQEPNSFHKPDVRVERGKTYNIETSIENENFQGEASQILQPK